MFKFKMVISPDTPNEKTTTIEFIKDHIYYSQGTQLTCGTGRAKKYVRLGYAKYLEIKTEEKND